MPNEFERFVPLALMECDSCGHMALPRVRQMPYLGPVAYRCAECNSRLFVFQPYLFINGLVALAAASLLGIGIFMDPLSHYMVQFLTLNIGFVLGTYWYFMLEPKRRRFSRRQLSRLYAMIGSAKAKAPERAARVKAGIQRSIELMEKQSKG